MQRNIVCILVDAGQQSLADAHLIQQLVDAEGNRDIHCVIVADHIDTVAQIELSAHLVVVLVCGQISMGANLCQGVLEGLQGDGLIFDDGINVVLQELECDLVGDLVDIVLGHIAGADQCSQVDFIDLLQLQTVDIAGHVQSNLHFGCCCVTAALEGDDLSQRGQSLGSGVHVGSHVSGNAIHVDQEGQVAVVQLSLVHTDLQGSLQQVCGVSLQVGVAQCNDGFAAEVSVAQHCVNQSLHMDLSLSQQVVLVQAQVGVATHCQTLCQAHHVAGADVTGNADGSAVLFHDDELLAANAVVQACNKLLQSAQLLIDGDLLDGVGTIDKQSLDLFSAELVGSGVGFGVTDHVLVSNVGILACHGQFDFSVVQGDGEGLAAFNGDGEGLQGEGVGNFHISGQGSGQAVPVEAGGVEEVEVSIVGLDLGNSCLNTGLQLSDIGSSQLVNAFSVQLAGHGNLDVANLAGVGNNNGQRNSAGVVLTDRYIQGQFSSAVGHGSVGACIVSSNQLLQLCAQSLTGSSGGSVLVDGIVQLQSSFHLLDGLSQLIQHIECAAHLHFFEQVLQDVAAVAFQHLLHVTGQQADLLVELNAVLVEVAQATGLIALQQVVDLQVAGTADIEAVSCHQGHDAGLGVSVEAVGILFLDLANCQGEGCVIQLFHSVGLSSQFSQLCLLDGAVSNQRVDHSQLLSGLSLVGHNQAVVSVCISGIHGHLNGSCTGHGDHGSAIQGVAVGIPLLIVQTGLHSGDGQIGVDQGQVAGLGLIVLQSLVILAGNQVTCVVVDIFSGQGLGVQQSLDSGILVSQQSQQVGFLLQLVGDSFNDACDGVFCICVEDQGQILIREGVLVFGSACIGIGNTLDDVLVDLVGLSGLSQGDGHVVLVDDLGIHALHLNGVVLQTVFQSLGNGTVDFLTDQIFNVGLELVVVGLALGDQALCSHLNRRLQGGNVLSGDGVLGAGDLAAIHSDDLACFADLHDHFQGSLVIGSTGNGVAAADEQGVQISLGEGIALSGIGNFDLNAIDHVLMSLTGRSSGQSDGTVVNVQSSADCTGNGVGLVAPQVLNGLGGTSQFLTNQRIQVAVVGEVLGVLFCAQLFSNGCIHQSLQSSNISVGQDVGCCAGSLGVDLRSDGGSDAILGLQGDVQRDLTLANLDQFLGIGQGNSRASLCSVACINGCIQGSNQSTQIVGVPIHDSILQPQICNRCCDTTLNLSKHGSSIHTHIFSQYIHSILTSIRCSQFSQHICQGFNIFNKALSILIEVHKALILIA